MTTIKGLGFENFRVFKNKSDFELAPISILTGGNSSGKSTVIKALKLFHSYWNNPDGQSSLYFEEGEGAHQHQLGNFKMSLSGNSGKEELIVRYYPEKHILFGKIYVENVFELDKSNPMENGILKKSSIFQEDKSMTKLLYETRKEGNQFHYYINKEEIVNTLIPELKNLNEEQESYREKVRKYCKHVPNKTHKNNGEIENFGDYTGPAQYFDFDDFTAYPIINQSFCSFLGINYERCKAFEKFGGIIMESIDINFDKIPVLNHSDAKNYDPDTYKIGANSKLLMLLSQIPPEKYDVLEKELWSLIEKNYPEITQQFDEVSFINLIAETEKNIQKENVIETDFGSYQMKESISFEGIKSLLKDYITDDFESSYRQLENKILDETSYYIEEFESYKEKWHLNKGLYSNSNKLKLFGKYRSQKQPIYKTIGHLFDYIVRLEQKLFGSYDGSSLTFELIEKFQGTLYEITYKAIRNFSEKIHFIDSVRANTQRLYTQASQGTSFNDLLTSYMRRHSGNNNNDFLSKWVKEFGIGDDVNFKTVKGVGTQIFIKEGDIETNIVDMGYGVTQLLPILIIISESQWDETIVIEEPETNLHPKLQSKLADMFIDAHRTLNINFIIETHSEYLIRKLQYLTAKKQIMTDDTVIYYIDSAEPKKRTSVTDPQIRKIRIEENGTLTMPFGSGFYDEADNLAMELWSFT